VIRGLARAWTSSVPTPERCAAPFERVVVWTKPSRPMVCLEPWTAPRQALVGGDRRLLLAPGENRDLHCRYRLETLA